MNYATGTFANVSGFIEFDCPEQKEDRKDDRINIQSSNQSYMIDQRKKGLPPKDFSNEIDGILSDNSLLLDEDLSNENA